MYVCSSAAEMPASFSVLALKPPSFSWKGLKPATSSPLQRSCLHTTPSREANLPELCGFQACPQAVCSESAYSSSDNRKPEANSSAAVKPTSKSLCTNQTCQMSSSAVTINHQRVYCSQASRSFHLLQQHELQ